MTIATEQSREQRRDLNNAVSGVLAQQRRLLGRLEDVRHYLCGVGAAMYLPGRGCTFDNPVRKIVRQRRPVLLTVEVTDDALLFTGAISRPKAGSLVYSPIFTYDISMLYTPRGGGKVLGANNVVLAKRANDLLGALAAYGRRVSFNMHEDLPPLVFPTVVRDRNWIVAEDYSSVLGYEVDNPIGDIETVSVRAPNPAAKILARHGIDFPLAVGSAELDDLVGEFQAEFAATPELEISFAAAAEALLFQKPYIFLEVPTKIALEFAPQTVVAAMRAALPQKFQMEAAYADLLSAAKNPLQSIRVRRLSALQLFPIETAHDMPTDYAGTVLSRVDWAPSSARQDEAQVL